jgi:glycosyltransferase involved in cell wall biosynthesis
MTTVEAMFCGLPVIVSSDTGPAWTARDGAGLIFKNGDAADLSEKIKQIHTDKDLGWQLSQKGLLRVDDFERSRLAGMLYKKMEELFNRR